MVAGDRHCSKRGTIVYVLRTTCVQDRVEPKVGSGQFLPQKDGELLSRKVLPMKWCLTPVR